MNTLTFIALSGAIALLALTPGPGVFATISTALAKGLKSATLVVAGIMLGDIIFLLLAIYGLNAIATILEEFFIVIKYLAGVYLLYLGYKIWNSSSSALKINQLSYKANFFSGLFITLANPKVILFYLGFLPAFINIEYLETLDIFFIIIVVGTTLALVLLSYAYMATQAKKYFKTPRATKFLYKSAGALMIGTGSYLFLKRS